MDPGAAPAVAVVVNGSGGRAAREGAALEQQLAAAFAAQGHDDPPQVVEGKQLAGTIAAHSAADTIAIGGGDGTQGSAAALLMASGQVQAVLPLGTLNHLSVDLGIPADLAEAARIAVHGRIKAIDLAQVNDQVFVNNASVGLYTKLVRARDAQALPKWLATFPAAWTVLRGFKVRRLVIEIDGVQQTVKTPLLFIGNNPYNITGARRGRRDALDTGQLALYAVAQQSPLALIGFALRALTGRADPARDFTHLSECTAFTILGSGPIDVAHDGEVSAMTLPLRFAILPRALKVKVAQ